MEALALLVHPRTVDLVSESALVALRGPMGLGDDLLALRRDEVFLVESTQGHDSAWQQALIARTEWVNPNTQRYALMQAAPGAVAASAKTGEAENWPDPWLTRIVASDRPDLKGDSAAEATLETWLALPADAPGYRVTMVAWDREQAPLPQGDWPDPAAPLLKLRLWTLGLRAADAAAARSLAQRAVVTRSRTEGLLVQPHVESWTHLGNARPLTPMEPR